MRFSNRTTSTLVITRLHTTLQITSAKWPQITILKLPIYWTTHYTQVLQFLTRFDIIDKSKSNKYICILTGIAGEEERRRFIHNYLSFSGQFLKETVPSSSGHNNVSWTNTPSFVRRGTKRRKHKTTLG